MKSLIKGLLVLLPFPICFIVTLMNCPQTLQGFLMMMVGYIVLFAAVIKIIDMIEKSENKYSDNQRVNRINKNK